MTELPLLASELLGFTADARVLVVNCDDFGMHHGINAAVVQAIESGIAGSCSLMVPCPGAGEAMRLLRERPDVAFGVHLALVCEAGVRGGWGPVATKADVASLLDEEGELYVPGRSAELIERARIEDVEAEFRAQIEAVVDAGLELAHLDWHCLLDGGRGDIFELTLALAAEYGLAVRVWGEAGRRRVRGLPVVDHEFLDSFSLSLDGKAERYARLLRELPVGLSEWAVHPGLGDAESRAVEPEGWRVRRSDYEFLVSAEARELVRAEGIFVIDYLGLREKWRAGGRWV
ncbi:polysaccharide deacetylase family protein [Streptomyces sp. NBC_00878]|uniref:polysaccharide deacetylase family protein n=1 Tax=Streptomyces sp. NBC_00878 TaxID=2975854 RepID=UPI00224C9E9C|nr:polysaccharide deacetylase family protein [Streptomyces sp. NBC_00878]MCX4907866.1 polysaccharide deacetylase family protein [Streptomyces sp. NBC_00878]